jgi:hypothetical protein
MHKQTILEDVYNFCDRQHDSPNWHSDASKEELFRVFVMAQESDVPIPSEVLSVDLRMRLERLGRWDRDMQLFVENVCAMWGEWEYAIKHFTGAKVDIGGSG